MKKLAYFWCMPTLFLGLWLRPAIAHAQDVQDFTIKSFSADYYLDRNSLQTSTLKTVETIEAQFPDYDQNHGILRAIPESYQGHTVSLKIDSVTDKNNSSLNYTTYTQNGNLVLKIGDANVYVQGLKTYVITYEERNVAGIYPDHDEFYWNVNGDQWGQSFDDVAARLHVSAQLAGSLQDRQVCYAGPQGYGSSEGCTISAPQTSGGGSLVTSDAENLGSGQTLTIVVGFKPGTFVLGPEVAHERKLRQLRDIGIGLLAGLPPLIAGGFMFGRWRKFGDDPKGKGVIVPEYEPPRGLDPLSSDFILKEQLRGVAFSAMLIGLATRGCLTIYEIPKKNFLGGTDYRLELNGLPVDLAATSRQGLQIIFGDELKAGTDIKISDLKKTGARMINGKKFEDLGKDLSSGLTVLGYFIKDPADIKKTYGNWSVAPFLLSFAGFFIFGHLGLPLGIGLAVGLLLLGIVMLIFSSIMPARSLSGVEARDELLGLRDFIKLAEADQIRVLQSPQGAEKQEVATADVQSPQFKVKLFESLLPYAMLFGLEKDWAKQFKDIYTQPPGWYNGNWSNFNTVYLASSLNTFSGSSSMVFSDPSSSGSGFGGGGGAGGGGGGGGGGGW